MKQNLQIIIRQSEEQENAYDLVLLNHTTRQACLINQCDKETAENMAMEMSKLLKCEFKHLSSEEKIEEDIAYDPNLNITMFEE